jgi:bacterioferritin
VPTHVGEVRLGGPRPAVAHLSYDSNKPARAPDIMEKNEIVDKLNAILRSEVSGIVRYLHYSFMLFGPNRIPVTNFFRSQASEAMAHAITVGEKITALGGHPTLKVDPVPETNKHGVIDILNESLAFEEAALQLYQQLMNMATGDVALEEMARQLILAETTHIEEVRKMIKS